MSVAAPPSPMLLPQVGSPSPRKWSREEYFRLAELGFFRNQHVELIAGEVIVMSPTNEPHVSGVTQTAQWLWHTFGTGFYVRVQAPFNVGQATTPEPDVAVVVGSPKGNTAPPTAAVLIVEVAETSLGYDTGDKASLYAAAGVADYWVVDVVNNRLYVFRDPRPDPTRRFGWGYFQQTIHAPSDRVAPLAAPNSPVTVGDLLP